MKKEKLQEFGETLIISGSILCADGNVVPSIGIFAIIVGIAIAFWGICHS